MKTKQTIKHTHICHGYFGHGQTRRCELLETRGAKSLVRIEAAVPLSGETHYLRVVRTSALTPIQKEAE